MLQFGAAIGRICLDIAFHEKIFKLAKLDLPFEKLDGLRIALRQDDNGLDLGRQDVMEIHRILTESFPGATRKKIDSFDKDQAVNDVREDLPKQSFPLNLSKNMHFCGAFGSACVDRLFRLLVYRAKTAEDLQKELGQSTDVHPKIDLDVDQAAQLSKLVKDRETRIASFHQAKWIVPESIACSAGYSPDATMLYAAQTGVIDHLFQNPEDLNALVANGVVQGDVEALRNIFKRGVEEVRKHPSHPNIG